MALLVAKRQLTDRLYGATILVVRPIGQDQHIGFIVNRPSQVTLGQLFPQHAPSRKVPDPVFVGGPINAESIFALVQNPTPCAQLSGRLSTSVKSSLFFSEPLKFGLGSMAFLRTAVICVTRLA